MSLRLILAQLTDWSFLTRVKWQDYQVVSVCGGVGLPDLNPNLNLEVGDGPIHSEFGMRFFPFQFGEVLKVVCEPVYWEECVVLNGGAYSMVPSFVAYSRVSSTVNPFSFYWEEFDCSRDVELINVMIYALEDHLQWWMAPYLHCRPDDLPLIFKGIKMTLFWMKLLYLYAMHSYDEFFYETWVLFGCQELLSKDQFSTDVLNGMEMPGFTCPEGDIFSDIDYWFN